MAEQSSNISALRCVEENLICHSRFDWAIDSFRTILKKLKIGESHVFESKVIRTKWYDVWQIKLDFSCKSEQLCINKVWQYVTIYNPTITFTNLNKIKSETCKGTYNFGISVVNGNIDAAIHSGSELSSVFKYNEKVRWLDYEILKLKIQIMFFPFETIPDFTPSALGFRERLSTIQETEALFDFTIAVDGQELRTNKTVLALVSPVFFAMFNHDFKENREQIIHINDADVNSIRKFLHYAYTSQTTNFENVGDAIKLLQVAEKYQVFALRNICSTYLRSKIIDEAEFIQLIMSIQSKT